MLERGIDPDTLERFEVGWDEENQETIFPIKDSTGKLHGYVHSPGKGQYYYTGQHRGSAFFGAQFVTKQNMKVLVEGAVDALRVWQLSRIPPIASLGISLQKEQIEWLKNNGTNLICMFDNDAAGKKGTKRIWLSLNRKVRVLYTRWNGPEKDPGDVSTRERMVQLLESAQPFPNFSC